MILTVYTDGASRGNPGKSSYGFVIINDRKKEIYKEGKYIGVNTNNFAEYTAVLKALEYIKKNFKGEVSINFFMDSRLVVEQLSGRFKIKAPNLKPLIAQIRDLEGQYKQILYTHVPRSMNMLADYQANLALDNLN